MRTQAAGTSKQPLLVSSRNTTMEPIQTHTRTHKHARTRTNTANNHALYGTQQRAPRLPTQTPPWCNAATRWAPEWLQGTRLVQRLPHMGGAAKGRPPDKRTYSLRCCTSLRTALRYRPRSCISRSWSPVCCAFRRATSSQACTTSCLALARRRFAASRLCLRRAATARARCTSSAEALGSCSAGGSGRQGRPRFFLPPDRAEDPEPRRSRLRSRPPGEVLAPGPLALPVVAALPVMVGAAAPAPASETTADVGGGAVHDSASLDTVDATLLPCCCGWLSPSPSPSLSLLPRPSLPLPGARRSSP